MSGHERMRRIICWLDGHFLEQPSLARLAGLAGLSESQFHREFVSWTGVTPKDFLQCLTLGHARERLSSGRPVLEAALDAGLSGPGRLHDLCVSLEAATPGEIRRAGESLEIRWGLAESPLGLMLAGETARGVCHLSFCDDPANPANETAIARDWPRASLIRSDEAASRLVRRIFVPRSHLENAEKRDLRAWVRGTAFQVRVWRALLAIPSGQLTTYGRLAEALGKPGAARAVGSAVGANRLACLIPCHRAIRETGLISGYRWGVGRKRALIAWEGAQSR